VVGSPTDPRLDGSQGSAIGWRSRLAADVSVLAGARQLGALAFSLAILFVPEVLTEAAGDRFLWLYFSQLIVSSVLNLGIERLTARNAARDPASVVDHVLWGVRARLVTSPLSIAAILGILAATGAGASVTEVAAAIAWTLVVQAQGVVLAGLRSISGSRDEAPIVLVAKLVQALLLVGLVLSDQRLVVVLLALGAVDAAAGLFALQRLPGRRERRAVEDHPTKLLASYTGIEVAAFAYQRADLLLVGILLGAHEGATFGLAYRLLDGLLGFVGPAAQLLFARGVDLVHRGEGLQRLRASAHRWGMAVGLAFASIAILATWPLTALLPRFGEGADVARLLLVVVPLSYAASIRSHLLSAEDRNRRIIATGFSVLGLNVALNIVLVPTFGSIAAAAVLVASETLLLIGLHPPRRWDDALPFGAAAVLAAFVLALPGGV
jgi:O-antigen/teichoic acid export membrane protein